MIAVIDPDTHELTADYKRDVAAAIPDNVMPLDAFWCALEAAITGYLTMSGNRARRLSEHELTRVKRICRTRSIEFTAGRLV